jgi:hypothetical protein
LVCPLGQRPVEPLAPAEPRLALRGQLELRLEGVVAKREIDRYRPGERLWVRRKSPRWGRREEERELAMRRPRSRFAS